MSGADADRLVRRTAALAGALSALSSAELGDDEVVAGVCVTPGFRRPSRSEAGAADELSTDRQRADPLAGHRDARRAVMVDVLAQVPENVRRKPAALAEHLCRVNPRLVHPMTGEEMSLLDWVNRGGDAETALANAG